jgi:hypothetical protein
LLDVAAAFAIGSLQKAGVFMPKFELDPGWKGISLKGGWSNHESSLSDDEMLALAGQIKNIPGMSGDEPPVMPPVFKSLRAALASEDAVITITKGLHERDAKAHFDIKIATVTGTFHVFVAPGAPQTVTVQKLAKQVVQRRLAPYMPTGLSIPVANTMRLWPSQYKQSDLEKPVGRPRGYSMSIGNSSAPPRTAEVVAGNNDFY